MTGDRVVQQTNPQEGAAARMQQENRHKFSVEAFHGERSPKEPPKEGKEKSEEAEKAEKSSKEAYEKRLEKAVEAMKAMEKDPNKWYVVRDLLVKEYAAGGRDGLNKFIKDINDKFEKNKPDGEKPTSIKLETPPPEIVRAAREYEKMPGAEVSGVVITLKGKPVGAIAVCFEKKK